MGIDGFEGKSCENATDCPLPYVCVVARPAAGRTCEVLLLPEIADAGPGLGEVTYCRDAKPILDRTCVNNCHGVDSSGSGRTDFRLDYFESAPGGLFGAKDLAPRIKERVSNPASPMPPQGTVPSPTDAERQVLIAWVRAGAQFCSDAGTASDGGP